MNKKDKIKVYILMIIGAIFVIWNLYAVFSTMIYSMMHQYISKIIIFVDIFIKRNWIILLIDAILAIIICILRHKHDK